ncbi:hypothetical protein NQ314_001089 [Rhamnusium bicolor]|uniref:Uncharacterized protein n=1 Tax=Rhamnusium bicolor TaxID=1586634 RepID=A0AAV8ZT14_9CUCU|nr:hypothetical protein NQ314_001089 [Rhamnusium bicolor]
MCKYCDGEIISKHFARHLQRNHADENEVKEVLSADAGGTEKRRLLSLIRNEGNLDCAIRGHIIPKRRMLSKDIENKAEYAICVHCKAYYKRLCLSRHVKNCFAKTPGADGRPSRPLSESLIYSACQKKFGDLLNKLSAKKRNIC